MTTSNVKTRFAPSPTGYLHLGGARTALFSWAFARHHQGQFVLRIEDTDLERSTPEAVEAILQGMEWLGLDHDEGPYYQTQRFDRYKAYIQQLLDEGKAYYCYSSPEEVEAMRETARAKGLKPKYDGTWRPEPGKTLGEIPADRQPVVRFKNPLDGSVMWNDMVKGTISIANSELDELIIARPDGTPTYNFCVVVDDWETGITHVIRGDDHVSNTPRQILIYEALGLPVPRFGHVPMILGPDRQKLSKRHGARAVIEYQQDGLLPQALVNYLVRLGWSHGDQELFTKEELIEFFDGTSLNPAAAAFDPAKLEWCNAHFMRALPLSELAALVAPFVEEAGLGTLPQEKLEPLCVMFRERANNLKTLGEAFRPLVVPAAELGYVEKDTAKHFTDAGKAHLQAFAAVFAACEPFTAEAIEAALNAYVADNGLKFKEVAPPLRTALMGFMGGSHLNEIMAFLGKQETLARLQRAVG